MPAWDIQKVCYDVSQVLWKNPELKKVLLNIWFVEQLVRSGYLLTQITSNPCAVSGLPLQQYQSSHWISELLHNPSTSLTHHIVILYHTISKVSSFKEHLSLLSSLVHVQQTQMSTYNLYIQLILQLVLQLTLSSISFSAYMQSCVHCFASVQTKQSLSFPCTLSQDPET